MAVVLLQEDDLELAYLISQALGTKGHQTIIVHDALAAMDIIRNGYVEVVIADMYIRKHGEMSSEGGIKLLGFLQSERLRGTAIGQIPCIAITGALPMQYRTIDVLESAHNMGAAVTLRKPFPMPELIQAVDELVEDRATPSTTFEASVA